MDKTYKAGDRVRLTEDCGGMQRGEEYTVKVMSGGKLYLDGKEHAHDECCDGTHWELLTTGNNEAAPFSLILTFGDRFEGFSSDKALRARIAKLAKEPTANRTYTVYDIKRTRTVSLGVKITIK
jgi:hypothetical protein